MDYLFIEPLQKAISQLDSGLKEYEKNNIDDLLPIPPFEKGGRGGIFWPSACALVQKIPLNPPFSKGETTKTP